MTIPSLLLPPGSPFSKEVFKQIRPRIPRDHWPSHGIKATFVASPDGLFLAASFEGLPKAYGEMAAQVVREQGVDLVMASPAALLAMAMFKAKRWRDTTLYGIVPLLFAIPLLGRMSEGAMHAAAAAFGLDLVALIIGQMVLTARRGRLGSGRFSAEIPVPGMKIPARTG